MKKIGLMIFSLIIFAGCQKELADYTTTPGDPGNGGTDTTFINPLIGSWNFDTLHSQYRDSVTVSAGSYYTLTVSDLNYSSFGTNGTLIIDDSLFKLTGYTYSISTEINSTIYQDGTTVNNASYPFNYYVSPSSSTAKYQLIGNDSLYFPEGGFVSTDTSISAFKPYGLKFKIESNMLTFTQQLKLDSTVNQPGLKYHYQTTGTGNLYFHKN